MPNVFDEFEAPPNAFDGFEPPPAPGFAENFMHGLGSRARAVQQDIYHSPVGETALKGSEWIRQNLKGLLPLMAAGIGPQTMSPSFYVPDVRDYNPTGPSMFTSPQVFDKDVFSREKDFQSSRGASAGKPSWGDFSSGVVSALPAAIPAARLGLGGMAVAGGINGGLGSLESQVLSDKPLDDTSFWEQKAKQGGEGAGIGAILGPVLGGAASMVSPKVSEGMKYLISKGIIPTPGESLGGFGKLVESLAEKVPFAQSAVGSAKMRAYEQYNRAAINETLSPIEKELTSLGLVEPPKSSGLLSKIGLGPDSTKPQLSTAPIGGAAIRDMNDKIDKVYDHVLDNVRFGQEAPAPGSTTSQFEQDIGNLSGLAQNLNPDQRTKFNKYLQDYLYSKMKPGTAPVGSVPTGPGLVPAGAAPSIPPGPSMDGRTFKGVLGDFKELAARVKRSDVPEDAQLARALLSVPLAMKESLARQNPAMAASLANVDKAYAMASQINRAGAKASGKFAENAGAGLAGDASEEAEREAAGMLTQGKVFTPQDHLNAILQNDISSNNNRYAEGKALGQQLPLTMQQEVGDLPHNAGAVGKLGTIALLTTLGDKVIEGGDVSHALTNPYLMGTAIAGGGLAGLYTRPGQYASHLLGNVRPPGFDMIGALARRAAAPATVGASQTMNNSGDAWLKRALGLEQ